MSTPKPFSGKIVTVTGAAHGIGLATAKYLISRGATVSLADVDKKALELVEEDILRHFPTASLVHTAVNVKDRKAVNDWITATKEVFGRIDGCVNNAGK
jgi:NADP-dependent 3-hydroxy acid dehydrogenase YdfG